MGYPHEHPEKLYAGNGKDVLKHCFGLSYELMFLYEPFGQASSTYEDTGYPEMTALGMRKFLSVPENLQMLRDIGEKVIENLITLGYVVKHCQGGNEKGDEQLKATWDRTISEIKRVDMRTYKAIMSGIEKEEALVKKSQAKGKKATKVRNRG